MQEASDVQFNTKEHPDLYRRSIKGGYWVIALRAAIMLLGFAKSIIIANFFILENLGIIAVAAMMMEVLSTFTQTGFDTALVQKKENIHGYLDTAWTAGLVKGVVLFLILFFLAPVLASIRVPEDKVGLAISILRAMSVCFLISGVRNIGTIYFQKELQFRKVFMLTLASSLTEIVLSLTFIFFFRSIWGVIIAQIFASAVNCAGSYILSAYRPRLRFEPAKARELWQFGKWIYGQTILGYFLEMGDNFFVWFYLGLPQLALYKYAYNFANMPATHITQVIATVSFPAYSKIQDDIPRLRQAYLKTLQMTAFLTIPASFLVFVLGPEFVRLFLNPDFYPMVLAFQILAAKGLLSAVGSSVVLKAIKKPHIVFYFQIALLGIIAATIYPFTKWWGITGTALSTTIATVVVFPVGMRVMSRVLQCGMGVLYRPLLYPVIAAFAMSAVVAVIGRYLLTQETYIAFFSRALIGCVVYGAAMWIMDAVFTLGLRDLANDQLKVLKLR